VSTLKPRTNTIPIYQGDDTERLSELRMAVAVAERQAEIKRQQWSDSQGGPRRVGDKPAVSAEDVQAADAAVQAAEDAFDAFVDEAAERAVEVVVRAIGRRRFRDLVAAHPQRMVKGDDGKESPHPDDYGYGVNVETFAPALLGFAEAGEDGVRTILAPESATKSGKALEDFLDDDLTDGDYEKVFQVAYWINRAPGSDPKELRYSPSISATSE
jgi:hypothetical protein